MIRLTQRQVALFVLILSAVGSWAALLVQLITVGPSAMLPVIPVSAVLFSVLLAVYHRFAWRYTLPVMVGVQTALIVFGTPDLYVTDKLTLAVLMPALLSLILLDTPWIVAAGSVMLLGMAVRSGGTGPLLGDPLMVVIYVVAVGMMAIARLVMNTSRQAAETNAREAQASQIQAETQAAALAVANTQQERQLHELQTLLGLIETLELPVVELDRGVLLVPLVGALDTRRAQGLTDRILHAVAERRAQVVVLDVTGAADVDTAIANHLMKLMQAVRLLGSDIVISGVTSAMAITLTQLQINLDGIHVVRSVQEALEWYRMREVVQPAVAPRRR